jgi:ketosteroid isomerase-like protein
MTSTFCAEEQEVIDVNQARIDALVAGDIDTLDRYVGDDMRYVSATGSVQTKAQVFAAFRSGEVRLERQDPSDLDVRIHADTAIVGYRADSVTIDRGKRIAGTTHCTSVYVRRDGRWQLVVQHNTFIA